MLSRPRAFATFADAYPAVIKQVLEEGHAVASVIDPSSAGSGFGTRQRPARELLGHSFVVDDPRACLIDSRPRGLRLEYAVGQWVWTMSGSDEAAAISFYNSAGLQFSEDGRRLQGAFGHRLRSAAPQDQLDAVIRRLQADPVSRRAVAVAFSSLDAAFLSRDLPCLIALQFLLRDNALHAIVYMRSQSAAMVLPYDVALFMAMQCWIAAQLEVRPGSYTHFSGSLHVYEDEINRACEITAAPVRVVALGDMPRPTESLKELIVTERALRRAATNGEPEAIRRLAISLDDRGDSFFARATRVLAYSAGRHVGERDAVEAAFRGLPREWQQLLVASDPVAASG